MLLLTKEINLSHNIYIYSIVPLNLFSFATNCELLDQILLMILNFVWS